MRVGVYIGRVQDHVGVSLEAVERYAANLPGVEVVRQIGFRPRLTPAALAEEIRERKLERVVIAGDSPGYFKPAFTRGMRLAGGNPEEVRLASFREHGAGSSDSTI